MAANVQFALSSQNVNVPERGTASGSQLDLLSSCHNLSFSFLAAAYRITELLLYLFLKAVLFHHYQEIKIA